MRDDKGMLPLERAMENVYTNKGCPEVAHYLMRHGCDSNKKTITELLCGACTRGKLNIVKDLVEQHKLDPNSEFHWLISYCTVDYRRTAHIK